ncbi:MAG: hypothetical protein CL912_12965 [Deltaproteobacteria bacterium]|nr:hypothetical protein [Deltaproteobacteria bacterium]
MKTRTTHLIRKEIVQVWTLTFEVRWLLEPQDTHMQEQGSRMRLRGISLERNIHFFLFFL